MNEEDNIEDVEIEETLRRARNSDLEALSELCERFYPRVLRFMHYRVDKMVAEDLTNDVFVRVVRSIGSQTGRFAPWIFRIARNVVIDRRRHWAAKPEVKLDPDKDAKLSSPKAKAGTVIDNLDVERGLEALSDDQREIVSLRFIQGLSCAEVAEITGKTSGAVRATQFRALKTLKAFMNE